MNKSLRTAAAGAMGLLIGTAAGIIAAGPFLLISTASADPLSDRCNGQTLSCTHLSDSGHLMHWEYDGTQDSGYRAIPSGFKASPGDPNGDQSFFSRIDGKVSGTSDQWIPLAHWGCSQLGGGSSYSMVLDTAIKQNPQSSEGDIATVLRAGMAAYCPGVAGGPDH